MRTFKSILLAGAMLLATPAFFSSCQEDAPQLDYTMSMTVTNDFTKVVDAINNGTLKNEQAIAQLTAAIDNMNADQQTKLQAIKDVINSLNASLDAKLAVIEAAMKAQTLSLEGKLALIEDAMKAQTLALDKKCDVLVAAIKGLPDYTDKFAAIEKAISALPNYEDKLAAIEKALTSQTLELNDKLAAIEAVMNNQSIMLKDRIAALEKAIKDMPDYTDKLAAIEAAIKGLPNYEEQLNALNALIKDQNDKLDVQIAALEGIMNAIPDYSDKLNAIEQAIKNMPDYGAAINGIKDEIAKLVQAVKNGNKDQKDGLEEIAKMIEQLKEDAGIGGGGGGTTTEDGKPMPSGCVDLGLPSGILWGKYNLGTIFPSKPGDYYAWGEIETKKKYSDNYKFYGESSIKDGVIKYNRRDGKMVLELEDDAANVVLGVGYRIPTKEDWQELLDECKWEAETFTYPIERDPTQKKIITKWKVTGPNGNYIILPNSGGYKFEKGYENEDYTYYTTSTLRPRNEFYGINDWLNDMTAWKVKWYIEAKETSDGNFEKPYFDDKVRRMCGFVIRPVFDFYANK